MPVDIH